jgi:ethanolamine utilization protein EutN
VTDDRWPINIPMFLAEVIGQVVSTKKDEQMVGRKLLLLRPKLVDDKDPSKFKDGSNTIVAVDTVGAGEGELVMFCQGSSARAAQGLKSIPVDAAIVDRVEVHGKTLYKGG